MGHMAVNRGRSSVIYPLLSQSYLYYGRSEGQYGPITGFNLCSSLAVARVGTTWEGRSVPWTLHGMQGQGHSCSGILGLSPEAPMSSGLRGNI